MLFINSEKLLEVKDCAFHNLKSDLLMSIMEKKKNTVTKHTNAFKTFYTKPIRTDHSVKPILQNFNG